MTACPEHDALTARAMLKWPDVPASYGWLGLDGRGRWLIQGEPISHPGITAFLARQYRADAHGRWYVQNGPQRAFVDLELAPWVLHLDGHGRLVTHTGQPVCRIDGLVIAGDRLYLATGRGLGVLLDRDLAVFLAGFRRAGSPLDDLETGEELLRIQATGIGSALEWGDWSFPTRAVPEAALETAYGFVRRPRDNA